MIEHISNVCSCEGKKCIKCEKVLCIGLFYRQQKDKPLRRTDCKDCQYEQQKSRKYPKKKAPPRPDLKTRFLSNVEVQPDGCWLWTGSKDRGGYGKIHVKDKSLTAHRLSYELYKGHLPTIYVLDHLCRVRHCVNPDHLEPITQEENTLRGFISRDMNIWRDLYRDLYRQIYGDDVSEEEWLQDAKQRSDRLKQK